MDKAKTRMKIAVVLSQSSTLAKKENDLAMALHDRGHEVELFVCDKGFKSINLGGRDMRWWHIETESSVEYSYLVHLILTSNSYSVAIGHSYKSPLYYEAMFGGTPLAVIHEESFLFDVFEEEVMDRVPLWTQNLLQMQTMRQAEKVIVYSQAHKDSLSPSGIQVELLTEPVKADFGDTKERSKVVIIAEPDNSFPELRKILSDECSLGVVYPKDLENAPAYLKEAVSALVLCNVPSLDILKYGCSVVRIATEGECEPLVRYVPAEASPSKFREALVGKRDSQLIAEYLSSHELSVVVKDEIEKVLYEAVPAAIRRGRTRGW